MTTIVYKDGILAADRRMSDNGRLFGYRKKIYRTKKFIYGCSGSTACATEFGKFIQGKKFNKDIFSAKDHDNFNAIAIDIKTKQVYFYEKELIAYEVNGDFFCLGSGGDIAKGALLMGATPVQAIACAAQIDYGTSAEIDEIFLSGTDSYYRDGSKYLFQSFLIKN